MYVSWVCGVEKGRVLVFYFLRLGEKKESASKMMSLLFRLMCFNKKKEWVDVDVDVFICVC